MCAVPVLYTILITCCTGTDPEDVIRNAFACFDEDGTGKIHEDRLRELLTTMGDRFSDAEVQCTTLCVLYTCVCVCLCVCVVCVCVCVCCVLCVCVCVLCVCVCV